MDKILEIKNVTKSFRGKPALSEFSLQLQRGRVLGLLGPNGSGKTTLLKLIAGYLYPDSGELLIGGHRPGVETKKILSFLPDVSFIPKNFTIKDALQLYRDFFEDFDGVKARRMLEFMDLKEESYCSDLSKGMKEKLHLTLILSREADLYVLDEPIAGVDPVAREKILRAIIENVKEKSSMIITSHLVRDMEQIFEDVVFVNEGKALLEGNADELRERRGMSLDEIYRELYS